MPIRHDCCCRVFSLEKCFEKVTAGAIRYDRLHWVVTRGLQKARLISVFAAFFACGLFFMRINSALQGVAGDT